ncbi:hypothetical protein B0H14DRAFT_2583471 [Mycena olivaceomarginata]|nr:hypothetical protein B0H14DRAFT_2583471 [Mycena olivaceomarginata]
MGAAGRTRPSSDHQIAHQAAESQLVTKRDRASSELLFHRRVALRLLLVPLSPSTGQGRQHAMCPYSLGHCVGLERQHTTTNTPTHHEIPCAMDTNMPRNILADLLKRTHAVICPYAPRQAQWNPIQPGAPPRRPTRCKPPPSNQVPQAVTCSVGPPVKDESKIPATPFSPPQFPPIFFMFHPYTNTAGQAAHRKCQADTAQQEEWLHNANNGGPLPIHEPHQKNAIFDVRDNDPLAAVLRVAQKQLAAANWTRSLLTFEWNTTDWTDFEYPYNRIAGYKIYCQSSGFRRMEHAALPLCPHFANLSHTEFYNPPSLRTAGSRELGIKRESTILATVTEQTLGRRTRHWVSRPQLAHRPLKREHAVLSIPGPSQIIIDLDVDDDNIVIPDSLLPPSSSAVSSSSSSGRSSRPQPRPLVPAHRHVDLVYRYTDEEADANLQQDPALAVLTAADAKRFAETSVYLCKLQSEVS